MKRLTILILAVMAGMAWGQDTIVPRTSNTGLVGKISSLQTYHVEYENLAGEPYISVKPDSGGMAYNFATKQMNILITAGVLEEYLRDCHNDSTLWERHKANGPCVIDGKTHRCIIASHWTDFYKHKQPSLPGLLARIKRKYERVK